jgi:hypothetical protein
MAREAGIDLYGLGANHERFVGVIKAFEALVRADEREACAKACDKRYMGDNNREDMEAKRCAAAIRERSANEGARGTHDL